MSDNEEYHEWLRTASRAVELPDLRLWLIEQWNNRRFELISGIFRDPKIPDQIRDGHPPDPETLLKKIDRNQRGDDPPILKAFDLPALAHARLHYVTSDICSLVNRRAADFPREVVLDDDLLPSPYGLVYFQDLFPMTPGVGRLRALLWGPNGDKGIRISPYMQRDEFIWPQPSSFWHWDYDAYQPCTRDGIFTADGLDKKGMETVAFLEENRRRLGTVLKALAAPRLVDEIICRPSRAVRRRSDRSRLKLDSDVRIIDLHAPRYRSSVEGATGSAIEWSCRWIVHDFWRWQPCGPNNSERRYQLIGEFVKGPPDKPLRDKNNVYLLRDKNIDKGAV